jgi:hypothetical protein
LLDHPFQFLAGERDALVAEQAIGHRSQIVAPVGAWRDRAGVIRRMRPEPRRW